MTIRRRINRLFELRNRFGKTAAGEKLSLLRQLEKDETRNCRDLERLHSALCFIQAFPDTLAHHRLAHLLLVEFENRIRKLPAKLRTQLWDSGIAGTPIHYSFSFEVAAWLARQAPNTVTIDWSAIEDPSRLDELLELLLHPAEDDYFNSGTITSEEWISLAAADTGATDFDWLFGQLRENQLVRIWSQLYNAADLPLVWNLRNTTQSKSGNTMAVRSISPRRSGMRKRIQSVKKEIMRPLNSLRRLSPRSGSELIDVAMASLAVRHRETNHFNCANPKEVYLADVGEGISIAVFGLREEHRYPLEITMGFLILSNGAPIGYGGASAVFRQVNTGINIFDEYRGSEAAFVWTQVMRVYQNLFGCTRFIVNAYQFGDDNPEALESGAFWFYYRLGYRPVLWEIQLLAKREVTRIRRNRSYRSDRKTLVRLASCDMHLTLPGARASELFDERWLETSSMLASFVLAASGGATHADSGVNIASQVARDLSMRSVGSWSPSETRGLQKLAPIIAATEPATWPAEAKRLTRRLLRAKGGDFELDYAELLSQDEKFLSELRKRCRRADTQ